MSELSRKAAEEIASVERPFWKHCDVVLDIESTINRHGTLVSHEDAAWLKLARCPDPLTRDAAVKVMGREPDERFTSDKADQMHFKEGFAVVEYKNGNVMLWGQGKYWRNPTIGQFACLVAAARMGEKA